MAQRLLLNLLHFNCHWGGDGLLSSHRHCAETLVPVLTWLSADIKRRVTLEMSASTLLFLAQHYPTGIETLQELCHRDQVELLCCQVTPQIWPAFPGTDLAFSFRRSQEILEALRLPATRGFFSQEGFFGPGVRLFRDNVRYAVCKDDCLEYATGMRRGLLPVFLYHGLPVVVASNHVLNEISATRAALPPMSPRLRQNVEAARVRNSAKTFAAADGSLPSGLSWHWFHCGDGNHWCSSAPPTDLVNCRYDPEWAGLCELALSRCLEAGFEMATVQQFVDSVMLDASVLERFDGPLLEAGWNPEYGKGVLRWMGAQEYEWEDANGILTSASRARSAVVRWTEQACHSRTDLAAEERADLRCAWEALMYAEISDSLGWHPTGRSVQNGRSMPEELLCETTQKMLRWRRDIRTASDVFPASNGASAEMPAIICLGTATQFEVSQQGPGCWVIEVQLRHEQEEVGVAIAMEGNTVGYCPTGFEGEIAHVTIPDPATAMAVLPCSNGLVQLGRCCYVIKRTRSVHVAARVCWAERLVKWRVSGPASGRRYTWEFVVVKAEEPEAVALANSLNAAVLPPDWLGILGMG